MFPLELEFCFLPKLKTFLCSSAANDVLLRAEFFSGAQAKIRDLNFYNKFLKQAKKNPEGGVW